MLRYISLLSFFSLNSCIVKMLVSFAPYACYLSCICRKSDGASCTSHAYQRKWWRAPTSHDARLHARFTDIAIFASCRGGGWLAATWEAWRSVVQRTCGKINLIVSGIEFTWAVHLSRSSGKATKSLTTLSRYPNTAGPTWTRAHARTHVCMCIRVCVLCVRRVHNARCTRRRRCTRDCRASGETRKSYVLSTEKK